MTKAEAIEELQSMCDHLHAHGICDKDSNMLTACKMAISALEQQPCEEVSREAALNSLIENTDFEGWELSQALEAIEKLPSVTRQTKWIPVSERLPEDKQEILFSTKTDRVHHGRYYLDKTCQNWYSFKDELFAYDNVVTAWMPLPEPYEPQESEKDACKDCYYNDGEVHAECVICDKAESEE